MRMRLLTVLVPITLVIASAFLVPFTVDIDARRDQITAQISRDMNIDINAHGPVTLRLLPSPALQFENIISVINRPDGEQPDGEREAQGEQDGKNQHVQTGSKEHEPARRLLGAWSKPQRRLGIEAALVCRRL